jgi:hypothetical protein
MGSQGCGIIIYFHFEMIDKEIIFGLNNVLTVFKSVYEDDKNSDIDFIDYSHFVLPLF